MSNYFVYVYDTNSYNLKLFIPSTTPNPTSQVNALKFHPNSSLLAVGYANGTINIITINTGTIFQSISTAFSSLLSLDFSINSTYLAACGNSATINNNILIVYTFGSNYALSTSVKNSAITDAFQSC
jgi:WD40 repeat protein